MKKLEFENIFIYFLILLLQLFFPIMTINTLGEKYSLIINPIIWTFIFIICYIFYNKSIRVRTSNNKNIIKTVIIISLSYVIIYYLLGLIFGFLKTPYSNTLSSIIKNLWISLYVIMMQEYVRFILVHKSPDNKIFFTIISTIFIVINIEYSKLFTSITSSTELFKFISSEILPLIAKSFLCTYLVKHSSNISSMLYRMIPNIFLIIFPVVPNLDWFFLGIIELITAFIAFSIVSYFIIDYERSYSRRQVKKQNPVTLIPFILVLIVFICFSAGIFKYKPVAIMSDSMNPKFYKGDIVIINKLNQSEIQNLKVGDIIEYKLNSKSIIHRIYEINDNTLNTFITKGDNNLTPDLKEVSSEQIMGKVIFIIPKLGFPTVWLNSLFS